MESRLILGMECAGVGCTSRPRFDRNEVCGKEDCGYLDSKIAPWMSRWFEVVRDRVR